MTTEISVVSLAQGGEEIGIIVRRAVSDVIGEDVWVWTARKRLVLDVLCSSFGVPHQVDSGPPLVIRSSS